MTSTERPGENTPAALSPGARTTIRTVLVIAAALLLLGGLGGLTAAAVGVGSTRVVADSKPLPPDLRTLIIDAGQVPMAVRISTADDAAQPRVDMRFVSAGNAQRHELSVEPDGTAARVLLTGQNPEWLQWARAGELRVVLPAQSARQLDLTVIQQIGLLSVNADVDRLFARTGNGAIELRGSARVIEIHHGNGSIHSRRPIAVEEKFLAEATHGDIRVDFDEAPRQLDAVLSDGDITLGLPGSGPFVVNASTGSDAGRTVVRVPQTLDPTSARSVVNARSASGDVTIDQRD